MQSLEVSSAVRHIHVYGSLGVKRLSYRLEKWWIRIRFL